jgi:hypothetical protein
MNEAAVVGPIRSGEAGSIGFVSHRVKPRRVRSIVRGITRSGDLFEKRQFSQPNPVQWVLIRYNCPSDL